MVFHYIFNVFTLPRPHIKDYIHIDITICTDPNAKFNILAVLLMWWEWHVRISTVDITINRIPTQGSSYILYNIQKLERLNK